jgi:hypothetical protein
MKAAQSPTLTWVTSIERPRHPGGTMAAKAENANNHT